MSGVLGALEVEEAVFFDVLGININISNAYPADLGEEYGDRVEVTIEESVVYADLFGAGSLKKYKEVTKNK